MPAGAWAARLFSRFPCCFHRAGKAKTAAMLRRFLAVLLTCSLLLPATVRAEDDAAPFDADLQRLAEILGALHYLRGICGTADGQKWRTEMPALLAAETPYGDRPTRMIASITLSLNSYPQTY